MRAAVVVVAATLSACAWGDGEPFATLHPRAEAELERADDAALPDGWQVLASGYELRLELLTFDDAEIELLGAAGDEAASSDGHDHGDDDEAPAGELAVLHLPVPPLDAVAGSGSELVCEPSCDLPRGELSRARIRIGALTVAAQVRDGRSEPRLPGTLEVAGTLRFEPPLVASAPLELAVDGDGAGEVEMALHLVATPALLGAVDWAALEGEPLALTGVAASAAVADAAPAALALEIAGGNDPDPDHAE